MGDLARYSFVAVLLHLVGLGPVRATITDAPHLARNSRPVKHPRGTFHAPYDGLIFGNGKTGRRE